MHQRALRVPGRWRRRRDFGCCSATSPAQPARPLSQPRAAAARGGAVTQQRLPAQRPPPAQPPGRAPRRVFALLLLSSASRRGKAQPGPRSVLARAPRGPPASRHPPRAALPRNITPGLGGGQQGRNCCPRRCQQKARLAVTCPRAVRRAGQPREAGTRRCPSLTPLQQSLFSPKPSLPPARCWQEA